ncbi:MAG: cation diffusion facilitator family transporter [Ignavibacteria bacterium]|nr:cation diffusion facilitator family transporter [Ignavibacteria bacterium]
MAHNHNHGHTVNSYSKPLIIGIVLNISFVIIEVVYGIISNSVALIADAGHNFSDVISLVLALFAMFLIKKKSTGKYTYGFKKGSILIALLNSVLLLIALGGICREAILRFYHPSNVDGYTVIIVASIGILINGFTAYLFVKGKEKDLNIKSAFLHMLTDTLVSAGVVISGIFIIFFEIYWIDPVMSLVIVGVIFIGTWKLLKETISLSIDAVPKSIDLTEVNRYLSGLSGVQEVHDLHIWSMSTSQVALTAHLVMDNISTDENFLANINKQLHDRFEIEHTTIQIEDNKLVSDCGSCC